MASKLYYIGEVHLGFFNLFLFKKKKDSQVHIFNLHMYLPLTLP